MSVTIDGTFKFIEEVPSQINAENSSTIRGTLNNLTNFIVSPSHFDGLMSVTIKRAN